jgi:hypothetical protein
MVIPREEALFRLDRYGAWHGPQGKFENRRIISHFHRSIRRDEQGYHVAQNHRGYREKVYFPYEDTALFVFGVVKGQDTHLLLNTGKRIRLRPRNLFVREDNLYMRRGKEWIKFTDHSLVGLSSLLEDVDGEFFIRVKARRYRIGTEGPIREGEAIMAQGTEKRVFYFSKKGAVNTDRTLDMAIARSRGLKSGRMVVASATGRTALRCREKAGTSPQIIAVTYGAGSRYREEVEVFEKNRAVLEKKGILTVRGIHALSGVERTFENRYKSGFIPLNIVSDTLRMFSQGMKVCVEVAVMAAEAGLVTPDEAVVAVGGTGTGADTAVVLKPGYAASLFDTRILEILCMPT